MKIEVNYQGGRYPELEEKIRIALLQAIGAKQFCRGCRYYDSYMWFWFDDQREKSKK